jgi:hypothetical protein
MMSQSQRLSRAAARVLPAVLIAALAAAPSAVAAPSDEGREEFTRAFQKTLPLKAGQRLSIEHRNGDIRVRTHAEPTVSIDAKIRVSSSDKAGAAKFAEGFRSSPNRRATESRPDGLSRQELALRGQGLHLLFRGLRDRDARGGRSQRAQPVRQRGRRGLEGGPEVVNSNGKIAFRAGRGRQSLENSFGSIELMGNAGEATIVNSNGPVTASDIEGDLDVKSRFGRVTVARAGKRCVVNNSNGDITVSDVKGEATLSNSFGKLEARNIAGNLSARDTNGSLAVENIGGRAELTGSFGSVTFIDMKNGVNATGSNGHLIGKR